MNNTEDKALILIDKFHSGQATHEEVAQLTDWKNASAKNNQIFDELVFLLELIRGLKDWKQYDKKEAWSKLNSRITSRTLRITRQIMAAAAVLLFVIAATIWNFGGSDAGITGSYISGNDSRFSILTDGSELFLSENARIFTENFSNDTRFLRTEGSYFVNVAHDKAHPFSLETKRINIKVLGTSFKVQETDEKTVVKVRDGKVLITNYDGTSYELTQGKQFSISNNEVSIGNITDEDWGLFSKSYEDVSLFSLFNDLSSQYGNLKFSAASISSECKITTKIERSTIVEILEELDLLFDIKYTIKEGIITIEKVSC